MKYWLFDGKDAQGPFEPEELKRIPGFGPESLICPDGAANAEEWKASQFYLLKPPPAKAEPARQSRAAPAASRGGMGRIAEAGLIDESPSQTPQVQQRAAAGRRRVSSAALLTTAVAAAAAVGAYYYLNRPKPRPAAAAPVSAQAPSPVPEPAAAPVLSDSQIQEATAFVQNFKTQSPGRKLPAAAGDVFSPRRWKAAQTVGQALTVKSLLPLDVAAEAVLEKQGIGMKDGEREMRQDSQRWETYSERFLRAVEPLRWEVEKAKDCPTQSLATGEPTCFTVAALLRGQRGGPQERHAFLADLTARTVKPLDSNAWLDLDPKGLAVWGKRHIVLGEPIDENAVAEQAPVYGIPLEHHRHAARHAPIIPQTAPAEAADQGLDYTEPGQETAKKSEAGSTPGSDSQVLEKALLDQPQAPASGSGGQPAAAQPPAPSAGVPPGLEHPVSAAPAAPAPDSAASPPSGQANGSSNAGASGNNKGKSAMDMSVDELQQYLKRDGSANAP